jgi:catechol 2,3-dioxygenase-like lactoylglutathione lyase family enzyme
MDLTVARCLVTVTDPDPDPDKTLAFYRDVLGLELVMDVPNGDFRWITVGSKSQPGVQIVLSNYIQASPRRAQPLGLPHNPSDQAFAP